MSERSQDLYSRLDSVDEPTLSTIADVLELRGRHPEQIAIREAYLDLLGDVAGQCVLDLGCGTGVATRALARRVVSRVGDNGDVTGVDPTPAFVARAKTLAQTGGIEHVTFEVGDGRALRFSDGDFDAAIAVTVLSHLPDREQVLAELVRVVRPGGRLLVMDGDYASNQLEHPDRATTDRIIAAWRASVVDDPFLCRRLVSLVASAGVEIAAVRGHVHVEAGHLDESTSFIWQWSLFALRQALTAGAVTEDEGAAWTAMLREMNATGAMFGSVNYLSVLARRPI
jgi:ubiquinone/menaquinone biosynthesis C-methylase UbiE